MRVKLRFYVCQLEFESISGGSTATSSNVDVAASITQSDIFKAVQGIILETNGDAVLGAVQRTLACKYYNPITRMCIIRGPANRDRDVRAAVAMVKRVRKSKAVAVRILQVAGSLRTLPKATRYWHASIVSQIKTSAASDDIILSEGFFSALDADVEGALGAGT